MQNDIHSVVSLAAIVSAITSIITTIILKLVDLIFKSKLEENKTMLNYKSQISYEYAKRKMQNYPNIAALAYKLRNKSREFILASSNKPNSESMTEYSSLIKEYEAALFKERTLLESDGIFLILHEYKGDVMTFLRMLNGLTKQIGIKNEKGILQHRDMLKEIYQEMNEKYANVISTIVEKEDSLKKLP